ncbi:MAG: glycosyltransferase family 4 protein [Acidobacteria bacterium]|nr:glycosyltransferase family 4 protein [Acidobacteriota bacterium]
MPYTIGIDARKVQDFGIGTYIRHLVFGLAEIDRENQYVLFTGVRGQEVWKGLPDNFKVFLERSPVYSVRELFALSWRLFRQDLDLYHSTHYVLPAVNPCKIVVTIHDIIHLLYPEYLPSRFAFFYAQQMIRRSLTRGDRIVAVSQNTKTDLMEYFGVGGRKIQVIYNGVDDAFRERLPAEDLERTLKNLGLPRSYLLFVGNPKPHKNLDNVLKAYAKALRLNDFEAPLVFVGDRGGREFKIRQRAEQLGIANRLLLLGHVAQEALPAVYQGATLFLYPTLYEGFGLPVVEAMASGVPVITSDNSALKEVAEGYAHLVNPLDVDAMAEAIAHCMGDEEHRAALAKLGLRRSKDFRWQRTAERTLEVYQSVLGGGDLGTGWGQRKDSDR